MIKQSSPHIIVSGSFFEKQAPPRQRNKLVCTPVCHIGFFGEDPSDEDVVNFENLGIQKCI